MPNEREELFMPKKRQQILWSASHTRLIKLDAECPTGAGSCSHLRNGGM